MDRALECSIDVRESLIKTVDDLRPQIIEKYSLSELDALDAMKAGVMNAAVDMYVQESNADQVSRAELFRHVAYLLDGFMDRWGSLGDSEGSIE